MSLPHTLFITLLTPFSRLDRPYTLTVRPSTSPSMCSRSVLLVPLKIRSSSPVYLVSLLFTLVSRYCNLYKSPHSTTSERPCVFRCTLDKLSLGNILYSLYYYKQTLLVKPLLSPVWISIPTVEPPVTRFVPSFNNQELITLTSILPLLI